HLMAHHTSMLRTLRAAALGALLVPAAASLAGAQNFATGDSTLRRIYDEGMNRSQTWPLSQALSDSIGARLTGSPAIERGQAWLVSRYAQWGIPAHNEKYGTWKGWQRGASHLDLLEPRVRTLEATMLAWSPGTNGRAATGPVIAIPDVADSAAFHAWLPQVKGKFVLVSYAEPTCRPDSTWSHYGTTESTAAMRDARAKSRAAWADRVKHTGYTDRTLPVALENAGAAGVLTTLWSQGYGVDKIFRARTTRVPTYDVSCEDYGLLSRMAEQNQHPVVRMQADAKDLGNVPVFNTIAEIRGTEKPNEYVMLSAHFDSWDASSGATDNGTGTVTMLEAMRILKKLYPNPKRTILVGHWSGEEEGLVGSGAFAADHPEIVKGLHALFNQDNGTGRIVNVSASGLVGATAHLAGYFAQLPTEFTSEVRFGMPGQPGGGGSDFASFLCHGAPGFSLGSLDWEYFAYTWHTNRDTFDKIVFDDLKRNATMTAMLAYLASEDPVTMPRDQRVGIQAFRSTTPGAWPTCGVVPRSWGEWTR
ncbi:MAG TPA: M20/M25/M40 family metallo-hydrolase, partial [Candidatus Elarobacter sp.]|nr:M20/M25/M40 family metallo-hydrolase [Candidatus Elarobacter sp.]